MATLLAGAPFEGSLMIGHLHWDHTQGIPFFAAGDRPDARVDVHLPVADGVPMRALDPFMSPPFFPISVEGLRGQWTFTALEEGHRSVEDFDVLARDIPHPGGRTFGFRVSDGSGTIAYLSDHGPIAMGPGPDGWGPYHDAAMELVAGVDVLLHDAQFTEAELATRPHFGHSCIEYALALAERGGVGRLLLYHHDPGRTDDQVDALGRVLRRRRRPGRRRLRDRHRPHLISGPARSPASPAPPGGRCRAGSRVSTAVAVIGPRVSTWSMEISGG